MRTQDSQPAHRSAVGHTAWAGLVALALAPLPALAAGGGDEEQAMSTVVLLLLFVGAAYLITHYVIDQLERRFLLATGFEFILLGILLGPAVPEIHAFDDLSAIAPVVALAAGWVGLLYGTELDGRRLRDVSDSSIRVGFTDALGTGTIVTLVTHWALANGWLGVVAPRDAWIAALFLGATAAAGSSSALDVVIRRYGTLEHLLGFLRRAARMGDLVAICAFGVLFCVFHEGETATARPPNPSDWLIITLGIGVALGLLFSAFLNKQDSANERFVALVGIITFAAGAAFFLHISVLLVNVVLGVVLVNTSGAAERIRETLASTSRPVSLLLLVFAGALWRPVPWIPALALASGYILLRFVAKTVACWIGTLGTGLRPDLSRGLLAQGDVAVAMALSFRLVYGGPTADLAYTAVLVAVVVNELAAPRFLKGLLVDAGELRDEVRAASGG